LPQHGKITQHHRVQLGFRKVADPLVMDNSEICLIDARGSRHVFQPLLDDEKRIANNAQRQRDLQHDKRSGTAVLLERRKNWPDLHGRHISWT
jgi:hypothetical protein